MGRAVAFWPDCGIVCSARQTRPSAYAVLSLGATEVHLFGRKSVGPETAGICLLMVDDVVAAHDAVANGFRCHLGRLSHNGLPRLSRFRVGATRFTLTDGDGNAMIVIERGERDRQASDAWSDPALGAAERKLELGLQGRFGKRRANPGRTRNGPRNPRRE